MFTGCPLKDKKGITITDAFKKIEMDLIVDETKSEKGNLEMWKENSVVVETFIKPFKIKVYKYMASISKGVYVR